MEKPSDLKTIKGEEKKRASLAENHNNSGIIKLREESSSDPKNDPEREGSLSLNKAHEEIEKEKRLEYKEAILKCYDLLIKDLKNQLINEKNKQESQAKGFLAKTLKRFSEIGANTLRKEMEETLHGLENKKSNFEESPLGFKINFVDVMSGLPYKVSPEIQKEIKKIDPGRKEGNKMSRTRY